jgi:polysaccharide biosynthesis transport protein
VFNNHDSYVRRRAYPDPIDHSALSNGAPALYLNRSWTEADASTRPVSFVDAVRHHKLAIVAALVVGGLLGYATTIPQKRIYRAHVSLEFAGVNDNVLNTREVDPSATGDNSSQAYINTQARVLESEPLLKRVVERVKKENTRGPASSGSVRKRDALSALNSKTLAHALQVRPGEGTKLVDIYIETADPDLSAEIANTMAEEYMSQSVESRLNSTQRTSGWLTRQVEEVRAKLESSEAALQAYARNSNLVFTGANDGIVSEARLRQLQDEYSRAQADRVAKQSVYEGLLAENPDDETASLRDPALLDYQMKLSDLNRQLADLNSVYSPGYSKIQRLRSQIEELKKDYNKQHDAALARVKNDFVTAKRREDMLAREFTSQQGVVTQDAAKSVNYNILKREAETNRAIYEAMLQRVKSYGIASAMQPSNVRVIDPAEKPLFPYRPNVPMSTMFGAMGGFLLALVWAGVRDKGAINVEYPGQTKQVLQTPELGVIPAAHLDPYLSDGRNGRLRLPEAKGFPRSRQFTAGKNDPASMKRSIQTASWYYKSSLLAESVRSIRTSMLYGHNASPAPQIVLITSLSPAHGKTSVVSNLAIAMAELGKRVLMIDADVRSPTLHKTFTLPNENGLTNVLRNSSPLGEYDFDSAIQLTPIPNLFLMSSGSANTDSAISALFHSERMAELLARLRSSFGAILIDTPPLTLSDARILGPISDGVILVLRAGEVKLDSVLAAEERLAEDGSRIIGTVLNNWDPKSNGYGSYPDRYHEASYPQSAQV